MRRTIIQPQINASRDELLINFKPGEQIAPIDSLLPIWVQTWNKFQNDAFSYIVPAIDKQDIVEQNIKPASHNKAKHTFSFAYSTRQLKRVITMHSGLDIFPEIRKQITRIFYRIANNFVTNSLKPGSQNLFQSIVQGYSKIQSKLTIIISCLNLVLNKFITRKGIQDEIYSIINKELINHNLYQRFINSCMSAIDSLRNSCLVVREGSPSSGEGKDILVINQQVIQNITLLNKLKIFPFIQYLERSKRYYSQLLSKIPKNVSMFSVLHNFVRCQKTLEGIITPDEQKIQAAKKILKREHWRAIQFEPMIKVFCKQILDQMYDDMIEYVDYLIDVQGVKDEGTKKQNKSTQKILTSDQKKQYLKHLWQLTKVLQRNLANQKQNFIKIEKDNNGNRQNKQQQRYNSPSTKLLNRITSIISDIKKYIVVDPNQQNKVKQACLYKVINFKDNIISVISSCFDNDPKFLNAVMNAIQESIVEEEDNYNSKLCSIILSPFYVFPGASASERELIEQVQMIDQSEQNTNSNRNLNNKYSYQLFKLTPSKEQFVRKFEQEFSNYVLPFTEGKMDLSQQQKFIKPLQRQCGHIISRNIERMLNDVWKNGQMVYYKYQSFVCRILCIDWPTFPQSRYKLADGLLEVRADFQVDFLSQPQNQRKKLRWIEQCGKISLAIMGVQSIFSELQASIIILLSKSYRPIRAQQFRQVLQYIGTDIQAILQELTQKNIITYNQGATNYQLNYENRCPYSFEEKQKSVIKKNKKPAERDYGIIVQALIARILKRRKSVQKTDLAKLLSSQARTDAHQISIQEINNALERLKTKDIINVEKTRGIIKYIE